MHPSSLIGQDLAYGDVMLRRMLTAAKELRERQLRPPAPPTDSDLEARRAWEREMTFRADRNVAAREAIELERDTLHGLGEARIGPIEHAILDLIAGIDDLEQPVSLSEDEELIRETLFFPYHLSLTINCIVREWAMAHLTDEEWRRVLADARQLETAHRDKAEANRISKERKRAKGRA